MHVLKNNNKQERENIATTPKVSRGRAVDSLD